MLKVVLLLFGALFLSTDAFESSDEKDAIKYLSNFFDFDKSSDNLKDAIKEMQSFAGIETDGKLSAEVISHMNKVRCGIKDVEKKKLKRYVKIGNKWDSSVTYFWYLHTNWMPPTMDDAAVRKAIRVGLEYWQKAAKIGFRESPTTKGCSFSVSFSGPGHLSYDINNNFKPFVDIYGFDNVPGAVLAHCYYPRNGNMHYDNAETWTENTDHGINLRIVTAHEMGHGIGLAHSQDPTALMAPSYGGYISEEKYKLPEDDKKGAQDLYGSNSKRTVTTKKREVGKNQAKLCKAKNLEAVFTLSDDKVYIVADDKQVYRLDGKKVDESFEPIPLPNDLKGADSVFYDKANKQLVLLKGDKIFSATGSDLKSLKFKELKISGKGMYQGRSSASFARGEATDQDSQYFWIIQDNELISGLVFTDKVIFSRRSRPLSEVFEMSNNGKFPPSVDAAFMSGEQDDTRLFLFIGNSYYVGKPEGTKQFKYMIPAEYPKSFKTFLEC